MNEQLCGKFILYANKLKEVRSLLDELEELNQEIRKECIKQEYIPNNNVLNSHFLYEFNAGSSYGGNNTNYEKHEGH